MALAPTQAQHLGVDALAVVAHAQAQAALVVAQLHFDLLRLRVPERVAQGLAGNAEDLVAHDRMQVARRALHLDAQRHSAALLRGELVSEGPDGRAQFVGLLG